MQCPNGIKVYYRRNDNDIDIYNFYEDPKEQNLLNKQYTMEKFRELIQPLAEFLAVGENSFTKPF